MHLKLPSKCASQNPLKLRTLKSIKIVHLFATQNAETVHKSLIHSFSMETILQLISYSNSTLAFTSLLISLCPWLLLSFYSFLTTDSSAGWGLWDCHVCVSQKKFQRLFDSEQRNKIQCQEAVKLVWPRWKFFSGHVSRSWWPESFWIVQVLTSFKKLQFRSQYLNFASNEIWTFSSLDDTVFIKMKRTYFQTFDTVLIFIKGWNNHIIT